MRNNLYIHCLLWGLLLFSSCYRETNVLVNSEFQVHIENDNYTAPVSVTVQNNTTGADFYRWTFAGGNPAESTEQHPGAVVYSKAGAYKITLEAWNNNERDTKEFSFAVDSAVNVAFDTEILVNEFAPAEVRISNLTIGASSFEWTFEGGTPSVSSEQFPGVVAFDAPGEHRIGLTVSNGREIFTASRTVNLLPKIAVDFDIVPSFDDFDYEVPFTASLVNKTSNGLTYRWEATGGNIAAENDENTEIHFTAPGTYTITLQGDNEKETRTLSKEITLKPNTNLYTLKDVKFGIKKAEASLGCFYSLSQRKMIKKDEVNAENGARIHLVFFGLDAGFSRCYFLSPSDAQASGFSAIPGAGNTFFINKLDESSLVFTDGDFTSMTDDSLLRTLDIKSESNTTGWFTNVFIPRIVLFETESGIRGAIRIKAFVSEGDQSYILADIKTQKEKAR